MRTIAIENLKGGVGKTVTTISLAHILVEDYPEHGPGCPPDSIRISRG